MTGNDQKSIDYDSQVFTDPNLSWSGSNIAVFLAWYLSIRTPSRVSTLNITAALTETQALCCPSNYIPSPTNDTDWGSQLWLNDRCTLLAADQTEVITVTTMFGTDSLQAAASGPWLGINAYGVSIRWQSTDRTSLSTSTKTPSSSAASTTTGTPSPKPTISTSAKAGIAVGVVFFALIIILSIAFFAISRQRAASVSNKENTTEFQNAWFAMSKPELAATESKAMLPKELPENQILEEENGTNRKHFVNWNDIYFTLQLSPYAPCE